MSKNENFENPARKNTTGGKINPTNSVINSSMSTSPEMVSKPASKWFIILTKILKIRKKCGFYFWQNFDELFFSLKMWMCKGKPLKKLKSKTNKKALLSWKESGRNKRKSRVQWRPSVTLNVTKLVKVQLPSDFSDHIQSLATICFLSRFSWCCWIDHRSHFHGYS